MKNLLVRNLIIVLGLLLTMQLTAQVSGLSYTIAPTVEYNWFNSKSGIDDGFLAGAQFGFGFGEFVELRANYQRGFDLKTDLNKFGFENLDGLDTLYNPREINMSRYGGELKLNLSRGALLPYLTVGTGIQNLEADSLGNNKQIYLTAGLGIKFSAANRYTIGIQALRTTYRSNSLNTFLDDSEREFYNVDSENLINDGISNYALRASLVLYLGGRAPGQTSAVDRAYLDNFSGGFRGLSIPIEPTVMKIDFNDDLSLRNTWLAGASAGMNVGPFVGVRGFYWRALEDGEVTKFDDLAMYGGEARFQLNEGKGFTPWITIGGGQINPGDDYRGRDSLVVDDRAFAMGGFGLDLPFTKYFKATGYVRSILTSDQSTELIDMPDDIKNSWSYGASLNFILGGKSTNVSKAQKKAMDSYLMSTQQEYDKQIANLESQLEAAIQNQDVEAVKAISEQKEIVEQVRSTISNPAPPANNYNKRGSQGVQTSGNEGSIIRMTPSEFQLLLKDLMDGGKQASSSYNTAVPMPAPQSNNNNNNNSNSIDDAINDLKIEQQLADLEEEVENLKDENEALIEVIEELEYFNEDVTDEIEELVENYNDRINDLEKSIDSYEDQIDDLYDSLANFENKMGSQEGQISVESVDSKKLKNDIEDTNDRIDDLNDTLRDSFEELRDDLDGGKFSISDQGNYSDNQRNNMVQDNNVPKASNQTKVQVSDELANQKGNFAKLKYKGMSGFAGFGIGGSATFNIGYRLHYAVGDSTNIEFMPETFFGLGSPSSFGLMANGTYSLSFLTKSDLIKPYIGVGVGLMKVGDDEDADQLKGAVNFILGTSLNVWSGDLYVDYTARNLFNYNQLIVGYRFPF